VALANEQDPYALGTPSYSHIWAVETLLDMLHHPAKRVASAWHLFDIEALAPIAQALQMNALLELVDEVGARELARHLEPRASAASWGPHHGDRGGISSAAAASHGTDAEWRLVGEKCGLLRAAAAARPPRWKRRRASSGSRSLTRTLSADSLRAWAHRRGRSSSPRWPRPPSRAGTRRPCPRTRSRPPTS
jgi:hypothetical protein